MIEYIYDYRFFVCVCDENDWVVMQMTGYVMHMVCLWLYSVVFL